MEQSTVLKTFLDYVQISSESRSEKTFAKRVENDLRSLGLRVQTDHAAENKRIYLHQSQPGSSAPAPRHYKRAEQPGQKPWLCALCPDPGL